MSKKFCHKGYCNSRREVLSLFLEENMIPFKLDTISLFDRLVSVMQSPRLSCSNKSKDEIF